MTDSAQWEHFSHQADIGIRGCGPTLEAAFEQTAIALSAVITELNKIQPKTEVQLQCAGSDPEQLLIDWLNVLLLEMAVRRMLFSRFVVHIDASLLTASAWGEIIDPERHQPAVEVKAATYSGLKVQRLPDGAWCAQCVVDV